MALGGKFDVFEPSSQRVQVTFSFGKKKKEITRTLEDLFYQKPRPTNSIFLQTQESNQVEDNFKAIQDYLIEQFHLFSDLALGRNFLWKR